MVYPISFQSSINSSTNVKKDNNQKNVNSLKGSASALFGGAVIHKVLPALAGGPIVSGIDTFGKFNKEESEIVTNAVKQMLKDSGLEKKNVRLRFLQRRPADYKYKFNKEKFLRSIDEIKVIETIREGYNACFLAQDYKLPTATLSQVKEAYKKGGFKALKKVLSDKKTFVKGNSILLPQHKLEAAGFHELGHALNYNFSKFGRFLQKCKPLAIYAPMILGIYGALTTKSKPKDKNGELTFGQKTNNFLRDNAGKLTFAAALPMLIEEAMATIKGHNFAKKLIKNPKLARKATMNNCLAYITYILLATTGALAARAAVEVKDKAVEKKERKMERELDIVG